MRKKQAFTMIRRRDTLKRQISKLEKKKAELEKLEEEIAAIPPENIRKELEALSDPRQRLESFLNENGAPDAEVVVEE